MGFDIKIKAFVKEKLEAEISSTKFLVLMLNLVNIHPKSV